MAGASTDPSILSVGIALPTNYVEQEAISAAVGRRWGERDRAASGVLERLHRSVRVKGRHLALPLEVYDRLESFADANRAWSECALDLGERAAREALTKADVSPAAIDRIFFVSTTGIATPSIDARLVNRLGLPSHVKRTPIFGLGCAGGAAGIARAADVLRAYPHELALVVSVELCTLTFQRDDLTVANAIATGLFGDGAAAVVLAGPGRRVAAPKVTATRSIFYGKTEELMGWEVVDGGFKIRLSPEIPNVAREHLRGDVDSFLRANGLVRSDIREWLCHPGGPKVLAALQEALELPAAALERTWRSLERVGNLSSVSVALVLAEALEDASPGDRGVLLAMGPGFCTELALVRW